MVARRRAEEPVSESEIVVRLMGTFHDIVRSALHRLHPILKEHGVTMGQFLALHIVSTLGTVSVGSLARRLGVSAPAVSVNVDQLEKAGLVRRQRSERDARGVELTVTPRGREVERRVWSEATRALSSTTRGLPEADVATAVSIFEQIAHRLAPEVSEHPGGGLP